MIYFLSIAFTISFVFYFKNQYKDEQDKTINSTIYDKKWHAWGLIIRSIFFISIFYINFYPTKVLDLILSAAISMPIYDIAINIMALNTSIFYTGSSSFFDRLLGNSKWIIYIIIVLSLIILKIFI